MAHFEREPALERQQIRDIAANIARRLLKVRDTARVAPSAFTVEIESAAHVVFDIQHEIERLMATLPPGDALDSAVLTHVLESQQHALSLLELIEVRLAASAPEPPRPDPARAHAALIATAREIEDEARRHAASDQRQPYPLPALAFAAAPLHPAAGTPTHGPARQPPSPHHRRPPPGHVPSHIPSHAPPPRHPAARKRPRARPRTAWAAPSLTAWTTPVIASLRAAAAKPGAPVTAAIGAVVIFAGLVLGVLSLVPSDGERSERHAAAAKLGGRLSSSGVAGGVGEAGPAATPQSPSFDVALADTGAALDLEQPYLVVLATRPSTHELGQEFRGFQASYPELLGNAKARVDRVQGQDHQTYYRLSLIPPQSHDDAKALCASLKAAGLTGCWLRPLPIGRAAQ